MRIEVLYFVFHLKAGNEEWKGEGTWLMPQTPAAFKELVAAVTKAAYASAIPIVDQNKPNRFKVTGDRFMLVGPQAENFGELLSKLEQDDPRRVTWVPVVESRYFPTEGP